MKLYQVEHDNCEPYEDNYICREDIVYTSKEKLIKSIKAKGYKEQYDTRGKQEFFKDDLNGYYSTDLITIRELEIVDNAKECE